MNVLVATPMTPADVVREIVTILVSGIQTLGEGIGGGVNSFVRAIAIDASGSAETLSIWFVLICVFAGLSLCISLTRRIFSWLENLGN